MENEAVNVPGHGENMGLASHALLSTSPPTTALIVPTLNASRNLGGFLAGLGRQSVRPDHLIAIDSDSDDDTVKLLTDASFRVHSIPKREFDHGGTRNFALTIVPDAEIVIFLTQDAVLVEPDALAHLVLAMSDPDVGIAYGRQIARRTAGAIERHAREFNYPACSRTRSRDDKAVLGIKVAFNSNSFAAYRRAALEAVGGFPYCVIMGEDQVAAGRLLLRGWKIAYVAEATVEHSHSYSVLQEFRRHFDIGVFHATNTFLLDEFGSTTNEGTRFVLSELAYLAKACPSAVPEALLRSMTKFIGYRTGLFERFLPGYLKRMLAMHHVYFTPTRGAPAGNISSIAPLNS